MEEECEHGQSHIHIRTQIFFITFILQAALKISLLLKSQYIHLNKNKDKLKHFKITFNLYFVQIYLFQDFLKIKINLLNSIFYITKHIV